jgi:hypothetical protein
LRTVSREWTKPFERLEDWLSSVMVPLIIGYHPLAPSPSKTPAAPHEQQRFAPTKGFRHWGTLEVTILLSASIRSSPVPGLLPRRLPWSLTQFQPILPPFDHRSCRISDWKYPFALLDMLSCDVSAQPKRFMRFYPVRSRIYALERFFPRSRLSLAQPPQGAWPRG